MLAYKPWKLRSFRLQDAKKVVEAWSSEFSKTRDPSKRLAMIYLANDILQNSRKKGSQFVVEFYHKLPAAIQQLVKQGDSKVFSGFPFIHLSPVQSS